MGGKSIIPDHGVSEIKWFRLDRSPKDKDCLPGTIDFLNIYKKVIQKEELRESFQNTQNVTK